VDSDSGGLSSFPCCFSNIAGIGQAQRWQHALQTFAAMPMESIEPNVISFWVPNAGWESLEDLG